MPTKRTVEIERLLVDGVRPSEIARRFGISRGRVHQIKKKMLHPNSRTENKAQYASLETTIDGAVKLAGRMGGYIQDKDTKPFRKL